MLETQACAEMPRYKCHKIVHALKIRQVIHGADGTVKIDPIDPGFLAFNVDTEWVSRFKPKGDDPGYFVVYDDGYKSWSPTTAFESGYTRV